jgi:glutaminyl-peptide cyclotransferase
VAGIFAAGRILRPQIVAPSRGGYHWRAPDDIVGTVIVAKERRSVMRHRVSTAAGLGLLWLLASFSAMAQAIPAYTYEIVHAYPHDPKAFTEGLFYKDGFLYESTGLEGQSSVRKVKLETGEVVQSSNLVGADFGEGIVDWGKQLIGLTWKSHNGFVADLDSFAPQRHFTYPGEGWALTRNNTEVFMSDGSAALRVLDPDTLQEKRRIRVTAQGRPIANLNELEWVKGEIYANIWQTDRIVRIDPKSGEIIGVIDLSGLLQSQGPVLRVVDVLNGIAYDAAQDRLFVTGKLWPFLFEIRLKPK